MLRMSCSHESKTARGDRSPKHTRVRISSPLGVTTSDPASKPAEISWKMLRQLVRRALEDDNSERDVLKPATYRCRATKARGHGRGGGTDYHLPRSAAETKAGR